MRGVRVYLHRFVASDPDRGLHDHPWSWALSVILLGWYFEDRRTGVRRVRWLNRLTGESFHRVILPQDGVQHATKLGMPIASLQGAPDECWSLFIHHVGHGKPWGFLQPRTLHRDTVGGVETCEGAVFVPVTYPGGGSRSGEWWKTAPTGRQAREDAEAAHRADVYPTTGQIGASADIREVRGE